MKFFAFHFFILLTFSLSNSLFLFFGPEVAALTSDLRNVAVISVSYGKRLRNKTQLNSASRKETETQEKRHRGNGFDDAEKETERKKHHQISSRFHG